MLLLYYIFYLFVKYIHSDCIHSCNNNGKCTTSGNGYVCKCFDGYYGGDCSKKKCPMGKAWSDIPLTYDISHQLAICSNRGKCDELIGECICDNGFTGHSCSRMICPLNCSGKGQCRSLYYHSLLQDKGIINPIYLYNHINIWDKDMIYGCVCENGYEGPSCSLRTCPRGDDPLTGKINDLIYKQQYNEKQQITCSATSGTFTLTYRGETTARIQFDDTLDQFSLKLNALITISQVTILFSGLITTACTLNGNVITIEFVQDFGDLPLLVGDSSLLNHASIGKTVILNIIETQRGTKENDICSNRGLCDRNTGVCDCFQGYSTSDGYGKEGLRGDCGMAIDTIRSCPGEMECSGHGYCTGSPQYRCICMNGWEGGDCSRRTCPKGYNWFDYPSYNNIGHRTLLICSGMGICDYIKGECICVEGFEGASCDKMKCPGMESPCNGKGTCLTINQLGKYTNINGDPNPVTYGMIPNNPFTWDFNRIQGCLCDVGYEGHDCSKKTCPYGDDPHTPGEKEIQSILCTNIDISTFQLEFRGEKTIPIDTSSSNLIIKNALENLNTIGTVTVTYTIGKTNACTLDGSNIINIIFETELGHLPSLRVYIADNTKIILFTIQTDGLGSSRKGTTENIECSNNGLCDYQTGQCKCFPGMGSSSKNNQIGKSEDCGYMIPYMSKDL